MLGRQGKRRRLRDPERTREVLLRAGFREVHRLGFRSAGLDTILAVTGVTKGALHHHFGSKKALGYAIEEVIASSLRDKWLLPIRSGRGPHRHVDRHSPGDIPSAGRGASRLSPEQPGSGDVSRGRTLPQVF